MRYQGAAVKDLREKREKIHVKEYSDEEEDFIKSLKTPEGQAWLDRILKLSDELKYPR